MMNENIKISRILAEKIKENGGESYFVGGYVRDKVMGKESKDIDIEVHRISPEVLRNILQDSADYSEVGKSFGIFTLRKYDVDIAMPRKETQRGKGHRDLDVSVEPFIGTYNAAKRRDFTINAMMENILTGEIIDHFDGRADLQKRIIRHVDENTFAQDPLRILRAAQFAARFNFKICNDTISLSKNTDLTALSKERVCEETRKALLKAEKPSVYFKNLKIMEHISPWFKELELPDEKWNDTMKNIDRAVKYRESCDNSFAFMLFSVCALFENENRVTDLVSAITTEIAVKKYVLNMYSLSKSAYQAAKDKADAYRTNKIFDRAIDSKAILSAVKAIYGENSEINSFLKARLTHYNSVLSDGKVSGKDLIKAGFTPDSNFSDILSSAHNLQLHGYTKDEAFKKIIKNKFV